MKYYVTLPSGKEHVVDIEEDAAGAFSVAVDGERVEAEMIGNVGVATAKSRTTRAQTACVRVGGRSIELWLEGTPPELGVIADGARFFAKVESERMRIQAAAKPASAFEGGTVKSPMPGRVVRVLVAEGDVVEAGAPVAVVEAMKMENELVAPKAGKVVRVHVQPGATVEGRAVLIEIQ